VAPLAGLDRDAAESAFREMEDEAAALLHEEGFDEGAQHFVRTVDVRYAGQEHSVTVAFPGQDGDVVRSIEEDFTRLHERQYGHAMDDPVEITTFRVRATGVVDKPSLPEMRPRQEGAPEPTGVRSVFLSDQQPDAKYALYTRETLLAGDVLEGPAVVAEHTATTVLHAGDVLRVGRHGEMVITIRSDTAEAAR
jgi:N-methylhydantoinase A